MLFWIILFIASYATHTIVLKNTSNMNHNINKVYNSALVVSIMLSVANIVYSSHNVLLYILISIIIMLLIKDQVFIDDDQYLSSMIENHQQGIEYSERIKEKTGNPAVKIIADKIITGNTEEILQMKNLVGIYRPLLLIR